MPSLHFILFALLILTAGRSPAQDTLFHPDRKIHFVLNLDTRQSFIFTGVARDIGLYGIKGGIDFEKKFRLGLGYYDMLTSRYIPYVFQGSSYFLDVHMRYITGYMEIVLFHNEKWDVSVPLQYGYSYTTIQRRNASETILNSRIDNYNLLELSVSGYYKIWNWLGVGAGAGYRYMLEQEALKDFFNAPIYIIRLKLFPLEIYHDLFHQKQD